MMQYNHIFILVQIIQICVIILVLDIILMMMEKIYVLIKVIVRILQDINMLINIKVINVFLNVQNKRWHLMLVMTIGVKQYLQNVLMNLYLIKHNTNIIVFQEMFVHQHAHIQR